MTNNPTSVRHLKLGDEALRNGDLPSAEAHFRAAIQVDSDCSEAFVRLARVVSGPGRTAESIAAARRAIELDPSLTMAHGLLASLLQRRGEFSDAIEAARSAIRLAPDLCPPYADIVRCKRIDESDVALIERIETMLSNPARSDVDRLVLEFALGKAYDDLGRYATAIQHFDKGNAIALRQFGPRLAYDPRAEERLTNLLIECCSRSRLEVLNSMGLEDETPVFIVGMIRSGTTLLDSILARHSQIASAGELKFWERESSHLLPLLSDQSLSSHQLAHTAERFLKLLKSVSRSSPRVIDKMPLNFRHVGLIHAAFPKARFIHLRRHPVDTCLSIWTTEFGLGMPRFAHSKPNIVHAYREYLRLMIHWRETIPSSNWRELEYELLTEDLRSQIEPTLGFLGLEWDEKVLTSGDSEIDILTPSRWQVRQPLYRSSVQRWRNYEPWLGELGLGQLGLGELGLGELGHGELGEVRPVTSQNSD